MTQPTYPDLDGASVFITGGGSGIGAALTEGFLRQGAKVGFIGRSDYSDFVDEMERRTGIRPLFVQGDATRKDELTGALDQAAAAHGALDVLVNNAANDMRYDVGEIGEDDWNSQIAINLSHQFFAAQHAAEAMKARGHAGRIVNYTSITFKQGAPGMVPYETSKAGIVGLTRALARDYGTAGIRVNCLAPGMVLTDKQLDKWIDDEAKQAMIDDQCLKVELKPEDMVGPTLFLASAASGSITGQCLIADAGVEFGA
ncbi:SDR family NAD(P)-dependent oxidoreductase [Wenxinia saemankumensis]|uniref:NAD(P)-dependent dehydrogenase, short-chain alcohol dehydrogenase family n=1 Tax=Wenxinia saemankumensis TaxID=1447782 RepID=A0A1M6E500_9RHOB|nr:SDR family oxidoreductase [Wenxinia saemankumensis]SHI80552.1 NAD(P)-dependent dehydrogenase, short-chain alcohol dehydrogenase family [Wenxinia saemankumensis]